MSKFLDALRIRRSRGTQVASMDREATSEDLDALREFEWTRRRVGSPKVARRLAHELEIPVYDVQIVGYPDRMRAYNARLKAEGRADRRLQQPGAPPVRTSQPPGRIPRPQRIDSPGHPPGVPRTPPGPPTPPAPEAGEQE